MDITVDITLYDYEASACCTKVRWALAEAGLSWRRERVDFLDFDHKTKDYLAVHPKGLVPAARIDGEIVLEADVIMKRIGEEAASARIWPDSDTIRKSVDDWLQAIHDIHMPYGILLYSEIFLPAHRSRPEDRRQAALANIAEPAVRERMVHLIDKGIDPDRLAACDDVVAQGFDAADKALARSPWLAGDEFTIADIALFPYVNTPMHRVSDIWHDRLPHLARWLAEMRQRPAFIEAVVNAPYTGELWAAVRNAPAGGGFRPV